MKNKNFKKKVLAFFASTIFISLLLIKFKVRLFSLDDLNLRVIPIILLGFVSAMISLAFASLRFMALNPRLFKSKKRVIALMANSHALSSATIGFPSGDAFKVFYLKDEMGLKNASKIIFKDRIFAFLGVFICVVLALGYSFGAPMHYLGFVPFFPLILRYYKSILYSLLAFGVKPLFYYFGILLMDQVIPYDKVIVSSSLEYIPATFKGFGLIQTAIAQFATNDLPVRIFTQFYLGQLLFSILTALLLKKWIRNFLQEA